MRQDLKPLTLTLSLRERGLIWGKLENFADVIDLYRIHNRLGHSGPRIAPDTSVGPLSLRERGLIWGKLENFADVIDLYRIHNRLFIQVDA
ncbi:hypothetical protein EMIT0347P_40129 [Pseudomonas sp. IT-347P]